MNAVTPFPDVERIVIQGGEIRSAKPVIHGRRWFWLEHISPHGEVTVLWAGPSLAAARAAAAEWADFGLPISDRTGGL